MSELEDDALRREELADLAHQQWTGWMQYLFSRCDPGYQGAAKIPAALVVRWKRRMATSYKDLSEQEKDSARAEADRVIALLHAREVDCRSRALSNT